MFILNYFFWQITQLTIDLMLILKQTVCEEECMFNFCRICELSGFFFFSSLDGTLVVIPQRGFEAGPTHIYHNSRSPWVHRCVVYAINSKSELFVSSFFYICVHKGIIEIEAYSHLVNILLYILYLEWQKLKETHRGSKFFPFS